LVLGVAMTVILSGTHRVSYTAPKMVSQVGGLFDDFGGGINLRRRTLRDAVIR
jgi:hypothetical protein